MPEEIGIIGELIGSIIIDLIGLLSYFIPGIGELTDIGTAPMNMLWIYLMLENIAPPNTQKIFVAIGGIEELAPAIDIIPSATITWTYKWFILKN